MRSPHFATPPDGEKPTGGKVAVRLDLFERERGFAPTDPSESPKPLSPDQREECARIAQQYVDAAEVLHSSGDPDFGGADSAAARAAPPGSGLHAGAHHLPRWRLVGPTYMPNGQTYGSGGNNRVDVSGRVSSLVVDPSNRNHILAGAAAGGIWESRDRGRSWRPRSDFMPTLTTGAIAFDPSNPSIVYAGTGEGDFYRALGAGLLRSTNGGTTWSVHATGPFVGQGFHDLVVDPEDGTHLLAAARNGIYESNDGGLNWTRRRSVVAWTISMRRSSGSTHEVLAATSAGLLRSTNGGTTWSSVSLPGEPSTWSRVAARHAPSQPATAYVFGASGSNKFLWRRAGSRWVAVTPPSGLSTGQAWYDWFLGVSPDNSNQVYLGAINAWRGTRMGRTWSWTNITARSSGDSIHPDQHAIAFDPTDAATLYIGNDGGVYRSSNRGGNWEALNRGLAITEIEYTAHDWGDCRWLFGGTQDNGSIRYRGSSVFDHAADGDGGDCGVNRQNPNIVYHSFFGMGMERSTQKGDFGSWSWIGPNVPAGYQRLFYPPLEVNGTTVAQAGQSVYVSRNGGTNWTNVALPAGLVASAMHAPTANVIFVGTTTGRVFRIRWNGTSWARNELTSPRTAAWIKDVHVEAGNLNRIWLVYGTLGGGRCFRSDDGGGTWSDRSAGLPNLSLNAVVADPGNQNRVWVAADVGVFQTFNSGASWSSFANGLPNVLVEDLLYHPHSRLLRAGTRNRGVWEIHVNGTLVNPITGVQWRGRLGPRQSRRWFTHSWPATWHVVWTAMPTTPARGAPELSWNVEVERADPERLTYWITVRNLTRQTIDFEGRYGILGWC